MRLPRSLTAALLALAPSLALAQGAQSPIRLPKGSTGPADGLTIGGTALPSVLGSKAPIASPTFTGTVTAPAFAGSGVALTAPRGDGALQRLDGMVPALDIARSEIGARTIILRSFVVSGYAAAGDAGSGARYVRGTAAGPMAVQDAAGTWWQLDLSDGVIRAGWLGVVANSPAAAVSNAAAINAGLAALGNRGGGRLVLPPGNVYVGATLSNRYDYVTIAGSGPFSAGYGSPTYPTTLVPTFAGTVVKHYSDLSGSHIVNGGGIVDLRVIGNGIATRNVEINTVWDGEYRFTSQDAVGTEGVLIYGDSLTNVSGAGSTQRLKIDIVSTQTAPGAASNAAAVVLDGAPQANVSINSGMKFDVSHGTGPGLVLGNTDNNSGISLRAFRQSGATGRSFIARANNDLARRARFNQFAFLSANSPGLIEGTETATYPASVRISFIDEDNGTPTPDVGTQGSLSLEGISRDFVPVVSAFSGTLTGSATARWSMSGHFVTMVVNGIVTNTGTGSGLLKLSLPLPKKDNTPDGILTGYQSGTNKALIGTVSSANGALAVNYDGSYPITANNQQFKLLMTYEAY